MQKDPKNITQRSWNAFTQRSANLYTISYNQQSWYTCGIYYWKMHYDYNENRKKKTMDRIESAK